MSKNKRASKKLDFNNIFHRDVHVLYVECDNYDYAIQEVANTFLTKDSDKNIYDFINYKCQAYTISQENSSTQTNVQQGSTSLGHDGDLEVEKKSVFTKDHCRAFINDYKSKAQKNIGKESIFIVVTGEDVEGERYGGSLFEGAEEDDTQNRFFLCLDKAQAILSSQGIELSNFIITAIIRDYFQNICKKRLMRNDIKDIRSIFATNVHAKMVNLGVSCAYPIIDKRSKKNIKNKLTNHIEKDLRIKLINTHTIRLRHFIKYASTPLKQIAPKGYYKYYYRFKARPVLSFCMTFLFIPIMVNILTTIIFERCIWEYIKIWIFSCCS